MNKSGAFTRAVLAAVAALFVLPAAGRGDIYKYVDANGVVHFTNTPTSNEYALYMRERRVGGGPARSGRSGESFRTVISQYASAYRLEEALIKAVIKVESNYNPAAVSRKGALGLMQLMPDTARLMNVRDPLDIEENVRGGSRYLRLMLDQFQGNLELALAAYNAGPNAVRRYGGIPPFEETRSYVDRVKQYLRHYRQGRDALL
jgi:soluble lytic murein transglycosylase